MVPCVNTFCCDKFATGASVFARVSLYVMTSAGYELVIVVKQLLHLLNSKKLPKGTHMYLLVGRAQYNIHTKNTRICV